MDDFIKCYHLWSGHIGNLQHIYHSNYGNYNFIAGTRCDRCVFYVNESIQICMISEETLPIKADFNHAWRND